jgi:hypothetical protein
VCARRMQRGNGQPGECRRRMLVFARIGRTLNGVSLGFASRFPWAGLKPARRGWASWSAVASTNRSPSRTRVFELGGLAAGPRRVANRYSGLPYPRVTRVLIC